MKGKVNVFGVIFSLSLVLLLFFSQLAFSSSLATHGIVGGTLGQHFAQSDFQAFIMGFVSHALLDFMPHHDPGKDDPFEITFYTLFNLGGLWTAKEMYDETEGDSKFLWGALGGMLPDLEHLFYFNRCTGGSCPSKIYPAHNGTIPHHGDASFAGGYLSEGALIGICVSIYF